MSGAAAPPDPDARLRAYVDKLKEQAPEVTSVNQARRLMDYYQVARQLLTQARMYRRDEDFTTAYIFYLRFIKYAVKTIPRHNAYADKRYQREFFWSRKAADAAFKELDACVDGIRLQLAHAGIAGMAAAAAGADASRSSTLDISAAVQLVGDARDAATAPSAVAEADEAAQLGDLYASDDAVAAASGPLADDDGGLDPVALPKNPYSTLEAELVGSRATAGTASSLPPPPPPYSSAPGARPGPGPSAPAPPYGASRSPSASSSLAPPPPPPPPPAYSSLSTPLGAPHAARQQMAATFVVNGANQQLFVLQCPGLRRVRIPTDLPETFLRLAHPNTVAGKDGIETLGVLAGTLSKGVLTMSHLILPQQRGERDQCHMTEDGEVGLFEACDSHDLLTLGWIHTHPCQACFMSSVDLHTHCGYQTMLPEAVAIVMAPNDARLRMGVFRLTTPPGLQLIQNCRLRGFHRHESQAPLYQLSPHIEYAPPDVRVQVLDLRTS